MHAYGPLVTLNEPAFIHPDALIYGKVTIGQGASVWPRVVMRAEMFEIVIGPHSNVQDFVLLHVGAETGTHIGAHCSITHHAVVHGARIEDNCLIGINATVMDGAVIGENSIVAGQSIVPQNMIVPPNSIVAGAPARVMKRRNNWVANRLNAWFYHRNGLAYARGEHRAWDGEAARAAAAAELRRLQKAFEENGGTAP